MFVSDSCVVENTRLQSMDQKQLALPRSDCEVALLKGCGSFRDQQISVTLQSNSSGHSVESKVGVCPLLPISDFEF